MLGTVICVAVGEKNARWNRCCTRDLSIEAFIREPWSYGRSDSVYDHRILGVAPTCIVENQRTYEKKRDVFYSSLSKRNANG